MFAPHLKARRSLSPALLGLFLCAVASGCQSHSQATSPESYVENGVAWAYGSVQLGALDAPATMVLKRTSADQNLDSRTAGYTLVGRMNAQTERGSVERDLAFVDYHPTLNRLLAFAYSVEYRRGFGADPYTYVNIVQRKPGRSANGRHVLTIGRARFAAGATQAVVEPSLALQMSLIVNGVYPGLWAVHFANVRLVAPRPWQGICPRTVTQRPGQNPGQNPGQFAGCKPLPAQHDLCHGDPTQASCRPLPPVQLPIANTPVQRLSQFENLTVVSEEKNVFMMSSDVGRAKLTFVLDDLAVDNDEVNAANCAERFSAVARTIDGQVNLACILEPAPSAAVGGKQACAFSVAFDSAQTYMERVCNVSGWYRGRAPLRAQVLLR